MSLLRGLILLSLLLFCGAAPAKNTASVEQENDESWRRAQAYIKEFTAERLEFFDAEGTWQGPQDAKLWRELERSAYVNVFFESRNPRAIRLANAIIENQPVHHFELSLALVRHRGKMTAKAVSRAEAIVRERANGELQIPRWRHFQGDNDNHPLMAAATVAMWGTYTEESEWIEHARSMLQEFQALLTRRGFPSEFNSPAYTGLQLHPLALIVENVKDEPLRKLARDLEVRVWIDLLSHYHPATGTQSGASARDYNFNIFGGGFTRLNYYLLLGDTLRGDWREGYRSECVEHGLVRAANRACVRYHCPTWLVDWTKNRTYPFQVIGSAEGAPSFQHLSPDEHGSLFHWSAKETAVEDDRIETYPSWNTRHVTYMTSDYALGTTERMFADGVQCNSFVATLPATKPLKSIRNTVRVHARYVIDDHQPGKTWHYVANKFFSKTPNVFGDGGRSIIVQHERTALVLYRPHVIEQYKPKSLKTMIFITNEDFGQGKPRGDEIYIGDEKVEDHYGESASPAPVYLRIGETYMAYIPLVNHSEVGMSLTSDVAVRVRPEGLALGISFYNYAGEGIELNARQCALVGGGFVCEMGSKSEDGSFEAFRKRLAGATIEDTYWRSKKTRGVYSRQVSFARPGLTLAISYNPTTEGIRYATVNGKPVARPQLEATGLDISRVPFVR